MADYEIKNNHTELDKFIEDANRLVDVIEKTFIKGDLYSSRKIGWCNSC